jgi:hypothetical protein
MWHGIQVLFSTYAHGMVDLKGTGPVSAEELTLEARVARTAIRSSDMGPAPACPCRACSITAAGSPGLAPP